MRTMSAAHLRAHITKVPQFDQPVERRCCEYARILVGELEHVDVLLVQSAVQCQAVTPCNVIQCNIASKAACGSLRLLSCVLRLRIAEAELK